MLCWAASEVFLPRPLRGLARSYRYCAGFGPMYSVWEKLSCTACTGLIAGKPGSYRDCAWFEADAVGVGAGLPAMGCKAAPAI
ncbi:hypothetical protein KAM380_055340 [Aeromonas caviae]|nr:hypothetical protein KAM380_055340 [Aeromonas caviae]